MSVHVPAPDELGTACRSLQPESHLLVGPASAWVVRVHLQPHALEVHVPKSEPAQRPYGIRSVPSVPVRLPDPDAEVRTAVAVVQVAQVARADGQTVQRLDDELDGIVGPA